MLSKKHNDTLYWKNKLEALDCLPVDTAGEKGAMWDKLHSRLNQKPAGSKAVWYWLAAGLLPLIIITLTMVNNTENVLAKHATAKEKITNATPAFFMPVSKESFTISVSAPVEKKQPVAIIKVNTKRKTFNDTIKASEVIVAVTALPEKTVTEITTTSMLPSDTTATTVIAKNKLQVVHINELETFPAQFTAPVNYAQNIADKKTRKNKPHNLNIATQQNIIGFKINLSSKN